MPIYTLVLGALMSCTWFHVQDGAWSPSPEAALRMQQEIETFVTSAAEEQGRELPAWSNYMFQYQGQRKDGSELILVHAFCSKPSGDMRKAFLHVLDGGTCYFRVMFDPVNGEFSALLFNGEA